MLFGTSLPKSHKKRFDGVVRVYECNSKQHSIVRPIGASTTIVDRKLALQVGGCDERVFVQDYSIALRLSLHTKFILINQLIAQNSGNTHSRLSSDKLRENRDTARARYFFLYDNLNISDEYKFLIFQLFMRKAWKWQLRYNGLSLKHLWRYIRSRINTGFSDDVMLKWMKDGLEVYV